MSSCPLGQVLAPTSTSGWVRSCECTYRQRPRWKSPQHCSDFACVSDRKVPGCPGAVVQIYVWLCTRSTRISDFRPVVPPPLPKNTEICRVSIVHHYLTQFIKDIQIIYFALSPIVLEVLQRLCLWDRQSIYEIIHGCAYTWYFLWEKNLYFWQYKHLNLDST